MNKIGRLTYLGNFKDSLIFASAEIGSGYGLPLDSNYILGQLHNFIKDLNFWCGDNYILNYVTS